MNNKVISFEFDAWNMFFFKQQKWKDVELHSLCTDPAGTLFYEEYCLHNNFGLWNKMEILKYYLKPWMK